MFSLLDIFETMRVLLLSFFLLFTVFVFGQKYEYVYKNPADSSFNCYLKEMPETDSIRGLIIRDFTSLPDTSVKSRYSFPRLSWELGMITLYTNTSTQFPELFAADSVIQLLDDMVLEVIQQHSIPEENIFVGGISASGSRALRYAQYCAQNKSKVKIRGVFVVDPPLDLKRFYVSCIENRKNFKAGMLWEADYMPPYFNKIFGGSPMEYPERYRNGSVFTHHDSTGGNAISLVHTDMILFHEPDIDWWLEERGASYFDINSYDIAAFVQFLRTAGNKNITLITTTGKGFDGEGNRKCHSWTIVDEDLLIGWIKERLR